jgi:hypothetical protein
MRESTTKRLALCAVLAVFVPWASAQRMASGAMSHFASPPHSAAAAPNVPGFEGIHGHFGFGHEGHPFSRFPNASPFGAGYFPLLADWFTPEDLYAAGYPVASQLPYVVVQNGPPASAYLSDRQPKPPQESLLIELQGDRYVRVNDSQMQTESGTQSLAPERDTQASALHERSRRSATHDSAESSSLGVAAVPAQLPPVILVLRDGTRQEVHDYTIADGVLYARGDLYTDGYWSKKIELSALNLPETIKSNQERGIQFLLPSAPNEVITRP